MATLEKIKVWRNADGTFTTTVFIAEAKRPNQTEDEFINSEINKITKARPQLLDCQQLNMTRSDFRNFLKDKTDTESKKLKINTNGTLFVDHSIKLPIEEYQEKSQSIKSKLVAGEKLTSEEADWLLS